MGRQNHLEAEEEQASVFVNHIPEGVEASRLLQVFSVFGNIRNGVKGIKVKSQRGKDTFAFIDFDSPAAVEKSVTSPPVIDGKQVMRSPNLFLYLPLYNTLLGLCSCFQHRYFHSFLKSHVPCICWVR